MSQLPATTAQSEMLLKPSTQFKREATKSVIAIVGFIIVYFLLFALSLVLVGLCFYAGFAIMYAKASFYTLIISLGIIACGVMVFVFLVKFLFASSKADNSDSIEITPGEQPVLFQTIHQLAKKTGTAKPGKIFLSPDVNAAVFYNSSFWSMFFPIRKNLKIGLGLINSVNVGELKAVIAHEFGHFSQRSMKVGSWVYQVNKIIYDMLFNNRGYANSLVSLANTHALIAIFVQLTIQVVKGIQWVLHQMFQVVNKSYLGLSRQMEFHADLVAASVCGSNNIVSALKRIEFADGCFAVALDVCNIARKDKKVVNNFYENHSFVVAHAAGIRQLSVEDRLPVLNDDNENAIVNRVNYKNQWASHPTLQEREAYLNSFELQGKVESASAWTLFQNVSGLKETLTRIFYKDVPATEITSGIDEQQFETIFTRRLQAFTFPVEFKEFYDNRMIDFFSPEEAAQTPFVMRAFDEILTEETMLLPKKLQHLEQDIAVLQSIIKKEIATSSFDFDGKKYPRKEAAAVLAILEGEKEAGQKRLNDIDQLVFRFFYAVLPLTKAEDLKTAYQHYFDLRRKGDAFLEKINSMMNLLNPVFSGQTMTIEQIQAMIADLKKKHEPLFKSELKDWLAKGAFDSEETVKNEAGKFLQSNYQYFADKSFFDNELIELSNLVQSSWRAINNYIFSLFKAITETEAVALNSEKRQRVEATNG